MEDWFAGPLQHSFKRLHLEDLTSIPTVRFEVDFVQVSRLEDQLDFSLMVDRLGAHEFLPPAHPGHCHYESAYPTCARPSSSSTCNPWAPRPGPTTLRAKMEPFYR